jgi:hypothetical protein
VAGGGGPPLGAARPDFLLPHRAAILVAWRQQPFDHACVIFNTLTT